MPLRLWTGVRLTRPGRGIPSLSHAIRESLPPEHKHGVGKLVVERYGMLDLVAKVESRHVLKLFRKRRDELLTIGRGRVHRLYAAVGRPICC